MALLGSDKACAEVGKVCPQNLCRQNLVAVVQAARQQHGFVEELTNFGQQGKGLQVPA